MRYGLSVEAIKLANDRAAEELAETEGEKGEGGGGGR